MNSQSPTPPDDADLSRTPGQGLTKEQALHRLLEGHWRYLANERQNWVVTEQDRVKHLQGQYPFAAILGCADSRVSPELIFDQGQGDLFVARVAGNFLGTGEIATLEYAVEYLGVRLIMILGHEKCGAVSAAINMMGIPGALGALVEEVAPAVVEARKMQGDLLDNAINCNVRRVATELVRQSDLIEHRVKQGHVRIVSAVYTLATGDVDIKYTIG